MCVGRSFPNSVPEGTFEYYVRLGEERSYQAVAEHFGVSKRGIVNVVGYPVYGDYAQPDPPRRIIDGVASGQVDVAVVWGPLAGFFASRSPVPLQLTPVVAPADLPFLPFTFDIAMGVRRGDKALRTELDTWIAAHRQVEIPVVGRQPRHASGKHGDAVIGAHAADDLLLARAADRVVVEPDELGRLVVGFRTGIREQNVVVTLGK